MGNVHKVTQTDMSAGEFSPWLDTREDVEKRTKGMAEILNMICLKHGPLTKRGGSAYIAPIKNESAGGLLYPFEFSTEQAYVLEFGELYVRVYKDETQIESAPTVPLEIVSPYTLAEINECTFVQSADFLYIFHPTKPIHAVTRTSDVLWTILNSRDLDGPYLAENTTTLTLTLGALSGVTTLTASAPLFVGSDLDRFVRIKHGTTWGFGWISGYTSSTLVEITIVNDFAAGGPVTTWRLGSWSRGLGYPTVGEFHDERLIVASTIAEPNTYWASEVGDFLSMAPSDRDGTVTASHAFQKTLAANRVNAIQWLISAKNLLAGTTDGIWSIFSGTTTEAISDGNALARREVFNGAGRIAPAIIDKSLVFVSRSTTKIREIVFDFGQDGFVSPDLTVFSEHIPLVGIGGIQYTEEPHNLIWGYLTDGTLLCMTFDKDQNVLGVHRHQLGATLAGPALVESIASIPSIDGKSNTLYMLVNRTIGGVVHRYVEVLKPTFRLIGSVTAHDAFFVDSGITYSGVATSTITGLDHLDGETVSILADGKVHPQQLVVGGQITLDYDAVKVHVGLPYTARMKTLRPSVETTTEKSQGAVINISKVILKVFESLGGSVGPTDNLLQDIDPRDFEDTMDTAVPLMSERHTTDFESDYEEEHEGVLIVQNLPGPFTVTQITTRFRVNA